MLAYASQKQRTQNRAQRTFKTDQIMEKATEKILTLVLNYQLQHFCIKPIDSTQAANFQPASQRLSNKISQITYGIIFIIYKIFPNFRQGGTDDFLNFLKKNKICNSAVKILRILKKKKSYRYFKK